MSFKLQQIPEESKFSHHLDMQVVERFSPREVVSELLTKCHAWEKRERKLSQLLIVSYVIALSLLRHLNVTAVFAHLSPGLRWLWPDDRLRLPLVGALRARRQSLGIPVLRQLFRGCCLTFSNRLLVRKVTGVRSAGSLAHFWESPANPLLTL